MKLTDLFESFDHEVFADDLFPRPHDTGISVARIRVSKTTGEPTVSDRITLTQTYSNNAGLHDLLDVGRSELPTGSFDDISNIIYGVLAAHTNLTDSDRARLRKIKSAAKQFIRDNHVFFVNEAGKENRTAMILTDDSPSEFSLGYVSIDPKYLEEIDQKLKKS